jgi:glycosyltransferase involved in cell wall biosynthesis
MLFHSNAPWTPTGYGQQTALLAPHLAERYDLAISSFYGLEGARISWNDIPVFPGMGGDFGNAYLIDHAKHFFGGDPRGGLVLTLMDVWVLNPRMMAELNAACWVPVDHDPAPPGVVNFFLNSGAVPIAMSKFGQLALGRLDPVYVPHAVDTRAYKPYDRRQVREQVGLPEDAFLVGMVAANKGRPSRKGFQQAFQAFKRFSDEHENAHLYLHTTLDPEVSAGENIAGILDALEVPKERVVTADQYRMMFDPYSHSSMAKIYSAMDVLLNPAMGEGFGIPVLEAQACGVPAIVTDFSAMKEVCGAGWHVDYQRYWTGQNSWQAMPDVDDIASALEECYSLSAAKRAKLSQAAIRHAQQYAVPRVVREHFVPALRQIEQRFANQEPVRIKPRLRAAA